MTIAIVIAVIVAAFAGFAIWMYVKGRKAQRGAEAEKTAEVQHEQLEEAVKPRSPSDTVDKLRSGDF